MANTEERLTIEERWPDLFEPLAPEQRRAVVQSFAAAWHEGWEPNREDVQLVVDEALGRITFDELINRTLASAARRVREAS